jgi:hypothetical protein
MSVLRIAACLALICAASLAQAADRDRIRAFLDVTGFDVALDSIRLSAGAAPQMLGVDPKVFGAPWTRMADEVFDTDLMRAAAEDILAQTLDDALLNHGAEFYATDLGQRLVAAENASHMDDDEATREKGRALVADMVAEGSPRLALLRRMNQAVDVGGTSVRALQEIQFRFLIAASAAGLLDLRVDPGDLRAIMAQQEGEMRRAIQASALAGAAWTYRDFTDAEVEAYAEALEDPEMSRLYELMNAVQFEIMAGRFEVLASRMSELEPGQEL